MDYYWILDHENKIAQLVEVRGDLFYKCGEAEGYVIIDDMVPISEKPPPFKKTRKERRHELQAMRIHDYYDLMAKLAIRINETVLGSFDAVLDAEGYK